MDMLGRHTWKPYSMDIAEKLEKVCLSVFVKVVLRFVLVLDMVLVKVVLFIRGPRYACIFFFE